MLILLSNNNTCQFNNKQHKHATEFFFFCYLYKYLYFIHLIIKKYSQVFIDDQKDSHPKKILPLFIYRIKESENNGGRQIYTAPRKT